MSVQSETSAISYAGNNSASTAYAVPFKFFDPTHLKVSVFSSAGVETVLTSGVGFTASGAGNDAGGQIVTASAWNNTYTVVIRRVMPATQPYSYEEGGSLPMQTLEENFDWLALLIQQERSELVTGLPDGATISWTIGNARLATVTLAGNRTLTNPTAVTPGTCVLRVVQDGTGNRTLAFGTNFKFPSGAAPVLSTAAGAVDILTFTNFGGPQLYLTAQKSFA